MRRASAATSILQTVFAAIRAIRVQRKRPTFYAYRERTIIATAPSLQTRGSVPIVFRKDGSSSFVDYN